MKSQFQHPNESPGYLLWKLTTEWQRALRLALKPLNLTHIQFVFLVSLQWLSKEMDEPITQNQLAKMANLDKMVVSETTKKLLDKKLITRENHTADSRSYALALTKKGIELTDKALPLVESTDLRFFSEKKLNLKNLWLMASKN